MQDSRLLDCGCNYQRGWSDITEWKEFGGTSYCWTTRIHQILLTGGPLVEDKNHGLSDMKFFARSLCFGYDPGTEKMIDLILRAEYADLVESYD